ncbi:small multi-drug export protein [bacterium]|nr:small multi-drug export protein [bacterium]
MKSRALRLVLLNGVLLAALSILSTPASAETAPATPAAPERHHQLGEQIANVLRRGGLPDAAAVFLIAALPVVELRGAVPVGHLFEMNPWLVYALAVAGNMVPVPLILLLLRPVSGWLMRFSWGKKFFDWLFARARRKSVEVEKYETLGLAVFVAIPLPVTGGWTGALVAFVLGMEFRHAFLSILLGVMIAGAIMTVLALMGWLGALVAAVVLLALAVSGLSAWLKREKPARVPPAGNAI